MDDDWSPFGMGYGYCNSCGEEAPLGGECCDDGEIVEYEDDNGAL